MYGEIFTNWWPFCSGLGVLTVISYAPTEMRVSTSSVFWSQIFVTLASCPYDLWAAEDRDSENILKGFIAKKYNYAGIRIS